MSGPSSRTRGTKALADKRKSRYISAAANLKDQVAKVPITISKVSPRTETLYAASYEEFSSFYQSITGMEFNISNPDALSYDTFCKWLQALCETSTVALTVKTVEDYLDRAILHIERSFLVEVPKDIRQSLKRYIKEGLNVKQNDINRDLFHILDLQALLRFFWCRDLYRYPNERSRLQLDFLLLLIAYTGSRPGAIVESRACDSGPSKATDADNVPQQGVDHDRVLKYGDIKFLVIGHNVDGVWRNCFAIEVKVRLIKIHQDDPTKELRIILSDIEDEQGLYFCPVIPFLALAFDDAAFANDLTTETLFRIRENNRQPVREISWRSDIIATPVCRMGGNRSGPGLNYASAYKDFALATFRAGFRREITFYWMRRNFANKIDDSVSDAKRNQLMCHSRSQTFNHYISKVSLVDVQAVMLDKTQRRHVMEAAQRVNSMRDERAPTELPLDLQAQIETNEEYTSAILKRNNCKSLAERRKLTTRVATVKAYLTREMLRKYREEWFVRQLATEEGLQPELYYEEFAEQLPSYIRFPDVDGSQDIRRRIAFALFGKRHPADDSNDFSTRQYQLILDCTSLCRYSRAGKRRSTETSISPNSCASDSVVPACPWEGCNEVGFKGGLDKHLRKHISKTLKCKWTACQYSTSGGKFATALDFAEHLLGSHGFNIDTYKCSFCPVSTTYSTYKDWHDHCKQHTDTLDADDSTSHRAFPGTCSFCLLSTGLLSPIDRLRVYPDYRRTSHMNKYHCPGKTTVKCPHRSCQSSPNGGIMTRQKFIDHASSPTTGMGKKRKTGSVDFLFHGAKRASVSKRSFQLLENTTLLDLYQEWHCSIGGSEPLSRLSGREQYLDLVDANLFRLCKAASEMVNRGSATGSSPLDTVNGLEQLRIVQGVTVEKFVSDFNWESA